MKYIPVAVSTRVARSILVGQKHSPTLLFGAGVAGVITSTVLACKATLQLEDVLEDAQSDLSDVKDLTNGTHSKRKPGTYTYTEEDARKDTAIIYTRTVVKVTKLYGPALVVGGLSILALTSSHRILSKRNAALVAAYTAVEKGFKEYRERVVDQLGPEKDREFYYGLEDDEVKNEKTGKTKKVKKMVEGRHSVYARFFTPDNSSWSPVPEYNVMYLRAQQNWLNDKLRSKGHVLLNDAYDCLGLERTTAGCVVGWIWQGDGDNYIDFGIFDGQNMDRFHDFVTGKEGSILLDFNVDGVIYDKIGGK